MPRVGAMLRALAVVGLLSAGIAATAPQPAGAGVSVVRQTFVPGIGEEPECAGYGLYVYPVIELQRWNDYVLVQDWGQYDRCYWWEWVPPGCPWPSEVGSPDGNVWWPVHWVNPPTACVTWWGGGGGSWAAGEPSTT